MSAHETSALADTAVTTHPPTARHPLDAVLRARSVAVIGASRSPTKRGYQAVAALLASGYRGAIHPINPAGGEILGLPVHQSLDAIDVAPDLALLCTPAAQAPALVEACGRRGVAGAIVLAVGFGEREALDGAALEAALQQAAVQSGVRVVGPNTSGVLNPWLGLNVIGVRGVAPGRMAVLGQSGNVALAALTEAGQYGAGFSAVIGVGNEVDLRFHDYLDWLDADPNTDVVLIYAEGFRDVRAFLETARRVTPRKPVVLLSGGRSDAGRHAARSHTGAVISDPGVLRDALRQAGVVEVQRSDELFPVAYTLGEQPPIAAGRGLAVLTDGGGHGTLAMDALSALGVPLATLADSTRAALRTLLGDAANVSNPVDLAGAADREPLVFARALELLVQDDGVGGVLVAGLFGGYGIRFAAELAQEECAAATAMAETARAAGRTLVVHTLYAHATSEPLTVLRGAGVPVLGSLEIACRCAAAAWEQGRTVARVNTTLPGMFTETDAAGRHAAAVGTPSVRTERFAAARAEQRSALLETEVRDLLAGYGVPVVEGAFCAAATDAAAFAATQDAPLAVKLVSGTISHKARAGGIVLGVRGADAAATAFRRIMAATAEYAGSHNIAHDARGVLLTPMQPPPLCELLVGARRHPAFGPVLVLGAGGSAVELLGDVATALLPVTAAEIPELLARTTAGRGLLARPDWDSTALVRLVLDFATCFLDCPELDDLELNPVFAFSDSATAIDARAFLASSGPGAS
jgi:acetate---CoA ligase (ADP-forming)